jgi:hypothetical protein
VERIASSTNATEKETSSSFNDGNRLTSLVINSDLVMTVQNLLSIQPGL